MSSQLRQALRRLSDSSALSSLQIDIDEAFVQALRHMLRRTVVSPTHCHVKGGICVLLIQVEHFSILRWMLQLTLTFDDAYARPMEQSPLFCPGCLLLISSLKVLTTHLVLDNETPVRTSRCHSFQRQMHYIREKMYLQRDPKVRNNTFLASSSYRRSWNPKALLAEAGNAAYWACNIFLHKWELYHCPWCSCVFPHVDCTSKHMQTRFVHGPRQCHQQNSRTTPPSLCCINFVQIRNLRAGDAMELDQIWFRTTLQWANLVRTLVLQDYAYKLAWTTFWKPLMQGNGRLHAAGRQVYALLTTRMLQ